MKFETPVQTMKNALNYSRLVASIALKVTGQFEPGQLLHHWPAQVQVRSSCHNLGPDFAGTTPSNTVSNGLLTLKLSVWR
jgi:hypothetical protein